MVLVASFISERNAYKEIFFCSEFANDAAGLIASQGQYETQGWCLKQTIGIVVVSVLELRTNGEGIAEIL